MNTPAYPNVNTSQSLYDWTQIIYPCRAEPGDRDSGRDRRRRVSHRMAVDHRGHRELHRGATRAARLESHFRWQIRTFWFGLIWAVLCGSLS